ncbi:Cytoskeleton protein RodZ [Burkholderiales bacterium]|nr:MAG: helix-turn-helix domain-containing protein [Burkholderiales bacterium]CAG0960818.1 Cytoskeleton protein RodZ [Burkholderiales bacterium]
MSEAVSEAALAEAVVLTPEGMGERLRTTREAAQLTVDEVAAQLRLSARQVSALEAEQFDQLPGRTFVRGFIRNYARLLHLDPEPLLIYAGDRLDCPTLQPITQGMGVIPSVQGGAPAWQKWAIFAALLAALGAGAAYEWWQHQSRRLSAETDTSRSTPVKPAPEPAAGSAEESKKSGAIELPLPAVSGATSEQAPAESNAAPVTPIAAPLSGAPATQASEATAPAPPRTPVDPMVTRPATAMTSGKLPMAPGKIGLLVSENCWVEVRDRSGQVILSETLSAGEQTLVGGEQPFDLVLGNAAAARLSFSGKAVDLAPHARQNVARLRLP